MILSFRTDRSGQTVQTLIRLEEQSDQGLHCLLFRLHHLDSLLMVEPHSSNFRVITTNFWGVQIFRKFTVSKNHVQRARGSHDLNMVLVVWKRLLVEMTMTSNSCVHRYLSYDVTVIQWLTSCHKYRMTPRYITLGYWRVMPWCRPWQRYAFYWNNVNF